MKEKINVILAADNNYAIYAAVTIASILKNTDDPDNVQFFLIEDEISEANKEKIVKTVSYLNSDITFIKPDSNLLSNVFVSGTLTKAAYLRLLIPDIVPDNINKIIYLDCDLLVFEDIQKLWNMDMQDYPVAAAEDFGILSSAGKCAEKMKNLQWKENYSYFNSGVLILNLKKWREKKYSKQLLKLVAEKKFRHHDQDALNYIFMDNWLHLPLRWNVIPPVFNMPFRVLLNTGLRKKAVKALNNCAIFHYAGGYKPWNYSLYNGFNDKYYEYLRLTAFNDDTFVNNVKKQNSKSITRQLMRIKWGRFWANICR